MTHDEMIEVIQAHKEGRVIQQQPHGLDYWETDTPDWNFTTQDFRVKPEPREFEITVCPVNKRKCSCPINCEASCASMRVEKIKVREVIE